MWLFAVFIAVPIIEIGLFIKVGGVIGLWPTLGVIVVTALLGSFLLRQQGLSVLRDLQREFGQMGNPVSPLAHGALVMLGGIMMILPGFFTDCLGLFLMIPAFRRLVIRLTGARIAAALRSGGVAFSAAGTPTDGVVEGEFTVHENRDPTDRRTLH